MLITNRFSFLTSIFLVCSTLMMTGCVTVGPDYETPESTVTDTWEDLGDPALVSEPADHQQWWKKFNDPVLDDLIQKAYQQNLGLQVAGLRVYEARAILGRASGRYYPQVQNLGVSIGKLEVSENAEPVSNLPPAVGSLVDTSIKDYRLNLDAAWELDFWGRFRRGVEASGANLAASLATYDDILVTLTGEVASSYVLLRTLQERLSYAEKNVAIQKRSLEIADVRFRNELVTELDVQLARTLLENTRATIPVIKTGIHQAKLALGLLLSIPATELDELLGDSGSIPATPQSVAIGIPADLLRRRPDIRRSELQAAAQSARIGIAKADMYPAFRLLGSVGYAAENTGDLLDSDSFFGIASLGFNWKFLNYGRLKNTVRIQDARFQQLVANYQNTVLNAAREVEDGLINFIQAKQRSAYLENSVRASKRAVELAQTQYRDGVISYSLVLDAQRFLVLGEDQLTAARGNVARSLIATYKALGGGWDFDHDKPLVPQSVKDTMSERTNWGGLLEPDSPEDVTPVAQ